MMRDVKLTMDDYMSSKPVYDPFHLLDCCLESDGAGAFVVAAADAPDCHASRFSSAGPRRRSGLLGRSRQSSRHVRDRLDERRAASLAMAGLRPADMDGAMIYDCFTFVALQEFEEAGFCARGEVGDFVKDGRIELGGKLPINTHGGLLSRRTSPA